nr:peroxidase 51 [Tanacetum cinerariifolium]
MMGRDVIFIQILDLYSLLMFANLAFGQLQKNYHANMCPNVETIVEKAVAAKLNYNLKKLVLHSLLMFPNLAFAQLQKNYYANMCPDVETNVEKAVAAKVKLQPK